MDLPPSSANRNQDMPTSGPSSEAVTSSEGAQRVDTEEHEADPRPQRLDRRDHSVRLLYHGNCSKCHHFHRHVAFKVKIDEAEHTRFYCERCRHPIFGLGRTDTQNSLASQDSFPINEGVVEVVSALDICSNRPGPLPSLQLNTSSPIQLGTGPLSAILEQSPQGQTRPTFAVSAHTLANSTKVCDPLIATRASRTGQHGVQTGRGRQDLGRENNEKPSLIWDYICKAVGKLGRRMGDAPHEVRFLGLRLHYRITSDYLGEHQPSILATALPLVDELSNPNDAPETTQDTSKAFRVGALSADPVEEKDGSRSYGQHNSSNSAPARHAHPSEEYSNQYTTLKEEHLRRERREKTLRIRALQMRCDCTDACHCKRECIEPSIIDSTRRSQNRGLGTPRSFQCVPAFPFGHLVRRSSISSESNPLPIAARPDPLTYVGGFDFPRWRPSNTANSTSTGSSSGGRGQASINVSDASSVSLHPSRPVLPGRSSSASLLPFSPFANGYDFGTREVFRSLELLHHARAVAAGNAFLPWRRSGSFPRMMPLDLAAEPDEDLTEDRPPSLYLPTPSILQRVRKANHR